MNKSNKDWNPFLKQKPNMKDFDAITCLKCENGIFDQYYKLFKLSAMNSNTGKTQIFNVPVFVCASCQHIVDADEIETIPSKLETPEAKENKGF